MEKESMFRKIFHGKHPVEYAVLLLFIMALPAMESPKNILWAAYMALWLFNRVRSRDFGGKWDGRDSTILLWLATSVVIAAFAGVDDRQWRGVWDIHCYVLLLWTLKRSGYGEWHLKSALLAVILSAAAALAAGFWQLYFTESISRLQLHSVGHVNHSAIYLTISYGVALFYTLSDWKSLGTWKRILAVSLVLFFATGIVVAASRASFGAMVLLTLAATLLWARKSILPPCFAQSPSWSRAERRSWLRTASS